MVHGECYLWLPQPTSFSLICIMIRWGGRAYGCGMYWEGFLGYWFWTIFFRRGGEIDLSLSFTTRTSKCHTPLTRDISRFFYCRGAHPLMWEECTSKCQSWYTNSIFLRHYTSIQFNRKYSQHSHIVYDIIAIFLFTKLECQPCNEDGHTTKISTHPKSKHIETNFDKAIASKYYDLSICVQQ